MKRISTVLAALIAAAAAGSAAAQTVGNDPNSFAIGAFGAGTGGSLGFDTGAFGNTGAGTFGVPGLNLPPMAPGPVPGIGVGVPSFGASTGDCVFSIQVLCVPLPGSTSSLGSNRGGALLSSGLTGGLVPGVINVPVAPDPLVSGSSLSGLGGGALAGSAIGGSTIGGSSIGAPPVTGGANPSTGLTGVINSIVPITPLLGGSAPIGTGSTTPLPAPGAGGGSGPGSSSGTSGFDQTFCPPDRFDC